jgi:hypothetical protein
MKTIKLTPTEYVNCFKTLATFYYAISVSAGMIVIQANAKLLEELGY